MKKPGLVCGGEFWRLVRGVSGDVVLEERGDDDALGGESWFRATHIKAKELPHLVAWVAGEFARIKATQQQARDDIAAAHKVFPTLAAQHDKAVLTLQGRVLEAQQTALALYEFQTSGGLVPDEALRLCRAWKSDFENREG
jgi:hypothetical protein